jgi:hypothetical protein
LKDVFYSLKTVDLIHNLMNQTPIPAAGKQSWRIFFLHPPPLYTPNKFFLIRSPIALHIRTGYWMLFFQVHDKFEQRRIYFRHLVKKRKEQAEGQNESHFNASMNLHHARRVQSVQHIHTTK